MTKEEVRRLVRRVIRAGGGDQVRTAVLAYRTARQVFLAELREVEMGSKKR